MNFITRMPSFQMQHGWGSVLAGIAGGVGGFFMGGPAGAIALGSQAYQAASSAGAEKNAAKQQSDAYGKAAGVYEPWNNGGLTVANTMAGALGIPGNPFAPTSGASASAVNPRSAAGKEIVGNAVARPSTLAQMAQQGAIPEMPPSGWQMPLQDDIEAAQLRSRSSYGRAH